MPQTGGHYEKGDCHWWAHPQYTHNSPLPWKRKRHVPHLQVRAAAAGQAVPLGLFRHAGHLVPCSDVDEVGHVIGARLQGLACRRRPGHKERELRGRGGNTGWSAKQGEGAGFNLSGKRAQSVDQIGKHRIIKNRVLTLLSCICVLFVTAMHALVIVYCVACGVKALYNT